MAGRLAATGMWWRAQEGPEMKLGGSGPGGGGHLLGERCGGLLHAWESYPSLSPDAAESEGWLNHDIFKATS